MKTTAIRRWTALLLTLLLALTLAAPALASEGGGDDNPSGGANTEISVRDSVQLNAGESQLISAAVTGNTSNTHITWTSQDTSIVTTEYNTDTLADSATFRALKPGVTRVTVRADDSGYSRTITVTVNGISLLKGNTVTVPENGSVSWTRGVDYELYGTAAEEGTTVTLVSDKSNVTARAITDVNTGKGKWVFNGMRQGGAHVTAQARTAQGATAGSSVEITVTVEENTATTITPPGTYSTANPLCFSAIESQIAAQCREMIQDANNNLVSVSNITVSTNEGTLYLGYKDADNPGAGVGTGMTYYVSTSAVGPYLKDVYFVPNPRFTGNTATITFTGNSAGGRTFKGKISVTVTTGGSSGSASVSLSTAENTPLKLTATPFSTAFRQVSGGAPLQSLTFFLPSEFQGTLYRDYVSENNYAAKLTASDRLTQSDLSRITFVPAKGYVGPVVIGFAGYTAAGQRYNGQLTVTVKQSVDGGITYQDGGLGQITFKESDFEDYCQRLTGARLG